MTDRYDIKELLGEGGFGETFVATDTQTGDEVVVKKLHLKRADDWKGIELFEREAEVLETLDHPRIPKYLDYFEEEEGDGMRLCLVQERAPGISLEDKVASGWRCDDPEKMLRELLDILIYLQSLRPPIVHRDIKPSNIVVADDGSISLVDFGAVANALTDSIGGSTMIGTLGYMAPEQQIGRVEMNTDLFGAAISVVYAATGNSPDMLPRKKLKVDVAELDFEPITGHVLDTMLEPASEDRVDRAQTALETFRIPNKPTPTPAKEPEPQQLARAFKPFQVAKVKTPALRQWVPLSEFMKVVSPSNSRRFGETESQIAEREVKSNRKVAIALDVVSALLCIGMLVFDPTYAAIALIVLFFATGFQIYAGFEGSRIIRSWQQSRSLGIETTVGWGSAPVTIEGRMLRIAEPDYPYFVSWGRAAIVFWLFLAILAIAASLTPTPIAFGTAAAVLYGGLKLAHYLKFWHESPDRTVELDEQGLRAGIESISLDELQLWVLENVKETRTERGSNYTPRYLLYGRGRVRETQMIDLGKSIAAIDRRVLEKIDQHVHDLQTKNSVLSFDTTAEQQTDEVTVEAQAYDGD